MRKEIKRILENRTDMAVEFKAINKNKKTFGVSSFVLKHDYGIEETIIDLKSKNSFGREKGRYITIDSPLVFSEEKDRVLKKTCELLIKELKFFTKGCKNVLIVGVGNEGLISDALGPKTLEKVQISRSFDGKRIDGLGANVPIVSKLSPNVLGNTGIESFDVVESVVDKIKPDLILVVDSLCSRSVKRIGQSFQISSAGIQPGSGVGNRQKELSAFTLNVPVVAIGVPMVVQTLSLFNDFFNDASIDEEIIGDMWENLRLSSVGELVVAPKEVDFIVEMCADIIAKAINTSLFG